MSNLYLYNKYIIYPQFLLKFPQKENLLKENIMYKIKMNIFMVNEENIPLLFLLNICLVIRLLFNEDIYVKKISNDKYILNKVHLLVCLKTYELFIFMDLFKNFLIDSFEFYNMGLNSNNFDIFNNYTFEFNYYDPIFTTKNIIIAWSPNIKIRFIFFFNNRSASKNKIFFKYLGIKFRFLKKKKIYY